MGKKRCEECGISAREVEEFPGVFYVECEARICPHGCLIKDCTEVNDFCTSGGFVPRSDDERTLEGSDADSLLATINQQQNPL